MRQKNLRWQIHSSGVPRFHPRGSSANLPSPLISVALLLGRTAAAEPLWGDAGRSSRLRARHYLLSDGTWSALNAQPGRLVQLDAGDNASMCIKGLICNKSGRSVGLARRQHPPTAIRGRLDGCRSGSLRSTQVRRTYFQLQCFSPARTGFRTAKFPVLQQQQKQQHTRLSSVSFPLSAQLARTIRKDWKCSLNLCAYVNGKKQMQDNCAGYAAQTSIWMCYLSCRFIYVNTLL